MPKTVELTPEEVEALTDYLDSSLISYIADEDSEVDNLNWVRLMTGIWYKCKLVMEEKDGKG